MARAGHTLAPLLEFSKAGRGQGRAGKITDPVFEFARFSHGYAFHDL